MTFNDISNQVSSTMSPASLILIWCWQMLLAFRRHVHRFFVYKKTFSGVMYSSSFGVTLIALTLITTLVILAVTSNVVLSLGWWARCYRPLPPLIKEPLDIAFLFWS